MTKKQPSAAKLGGIVTIIYPHREDAVISVARWVFVRHPYRCGMRRLIVHVEPCLLRVSLNNVHWLLHAQVACTLSMVSLHYDTHVCWRPKMLVHLSLMNRPALQDRIDNDTNPFSGATIKLNQWNCIARSSRSQFCEGAYVNSLHKSEKWVLKCSASLLLWRSRFAFLSESQSLQQWVFLRIWTCAPTWIEHDTCYLSIREDFAHCGRIFER